MALSKVDICFLESIETMNDVTIAKQNKRAVTTIYIDFSRAFETVSHPKLFHLLET